MERKIEKILKEIWTCYKIEEEKSLDFLNSYDVSEAQEIEFIDEEKNYACNVSTRNSL